MTKPTVLLLAGLLTACTPTLNAKKLKTVLQTEFSDKTGIAAQAVTCPQGIAIKDGTSFSCDLETEDGRIIAVQVTQTNDKGNIKWTAKVSTSQLEKQVEQEFAAQTDIAVQSVTCPQEVEIEAGRAFNCELETADGKTLPLDVTQQPQGKVTWVPNETLVDLEQIERLIQQDFQKLDSRVIADCGGQYRIAVQGDQFLCSVQDAQGETGRINVTVTDTQGNIDWQLLQR